MDLRAISPLLFPSVFLIRDLPRRLSNAAIITRQFVEARIVYSKLSKLLVNKENMEWIIHVIFRKRRRMTIQFLLRDHKSVDIESKLISRGGDCNRAVIFSIFPSS